MAAITVTIPDDLVAEFGDTPEALSQFTLEAMAIEAFRQERLGTRRLARLLGMEHGAFLDYLGKRKVPSNATGEELIEAYLASRRFVRS